MTLRHLRIFVIVADSGSMTSASQSLFVAQPTVSQAISELEDHYNVKLFDRLSRRLYITEPGKRLLSYARHIIALFDETEQVMKNPDASGILRIGASVTVGTYILPQIVREYEGKYPSLKIQAFIKNTRDIEGLILKNAVDFGVVEGIVHTSDIVSTPFMDDELVLVCAKNHPLYKSEIIPLSELSKLNYIVREQGSGTRELFESVMAVHDINWQFAWECNDSDGLKNAAINGIGVAVISKRLVENEIKEGKLSIIKVDGLEYKRKFSIIHHKNKYLTKTTKELFNLFCMYAINDMKR